MSSEQASSFPRQLFVRLVTSCEVSTSGPGDRVLTKGDFGNGTSWRKQKRVRSSRRPASLDGCRQRRSSAMSFEADSAFTFRRRGGSTQRLRHLRTQIEDMRTRHSRRHKPQCRRCWEAFPRKSAHPYPAARRDEPYSSRHKRTSGNLRPV